MISLVVNLAAVIVLFGGMFMIRLGWQSSIVWGLSEFREEWRNLQSTGQWDKSKVHSSLISGAIGIMVMFLGGVHIVVSFIVA